MPRRTLDIGVDLDGVAYRFVDALRGYIHAATGRPVESMPTAQSWNFYKDQWAMSSAEFLEHFRNGINDGVIFAIGAPYPGTVEALGRIAEDGHRIHIVTARMIAGAEAAARANTRRWLADWNIPHHSLVFSDDKTSVRTDVFLEDAPHNYDALDAAGVEVWLMHRRWNAQHPGRRVADWDSFVEVVAAAAARAAA